MLVLDDQPKYLLSLGMPGFPEFTRTHQKRAMVILTIGLARAKATLVEHGLQHEAMVLAQRAKCGRMTSDPRKIYMRPAFRLVS